MSHPVPDSALTQHVAILGMTGQGKSYCARTIVEDFLDQGRRVCIIDYTGVWNGLRSNASGKGDGYPVVIFGGDYGDVALNDAAGPPVARFVANGDQPVVIDLDGMTVGAQQRFVTAFCEELYRTNKRALHIVFEEADELAPQSGAPGVERMVGAVARIFQRGRKKGFRAMAITQRPANLHKRVLAQCKTMITLKLVAPQDRKAVAEWVRGHGDEDEGKRLMETLPKLQRGQGWVWAPEQGVLKQVTFPAIKTFDSMKAPEDGEAIEPTKRSQVDLDSIKQEMATLVEEAVANDPVALKAEIARLQKLSIAKTDGNRISIKELEDAERRGYERGLKDGYRQAKDIEGRRAAHVQMLRVVDAVRGAAMLNGDIDALAAALDAMKAIDLPAAPEASPLPRAAPSPPPKTPPRATPENVNGAVSPSARKIIDQIHAAHPIALTFATAAARAGISKRSSAYRKYRTEVGASDEVAQDGERFVSLAREPITAAKGDGVEAFAARLPPTYSAMLRVIAARRGNGVSREIIAAEAGVSETSSGLGSGLRELMRLGLIEKSGALYCLAEELQ